MKQISKYKASIDFEKSTKEFGFGKIFFCNDYETILNELNQICVKAKDLGYSYIADIKKEFGDGWSTVTMRSYKVPLDLTTLSNHDQARIRAAKKIKSVDWNDALRLEEQCESEEARDIIKTIRISLYHAEEQENI